MTYQEYLSMKQRSFDALPIFWAFGKDQFNEALRERGLDPESPEQGRIVSLGYGGYCLSEDREMIDAWLNREDELPKLMEDPEFAAAAFEYEMGNHEYQINIYQGDWDVCSCFGACEYKPDKDYADYLREIGYSEEIIHVFRETRNKYLQKCMDNDWF